MPDFPDLIPDPAKPAARQNWAPRPPARAVSNLTGGSYIRGAFYGLAAAGIWSGWIVIARLGLRTSLTPWDITALRFGVGGLLLLPYLLRRGLAIERLGWIGLAAIMVGCGAPMVLLVNAGLLFAPASHAGGLFSGVVPLLVGLLAVPFLHEVFTLTKRIGLLLISCGVVGIVWSAGSTIGTRQNTGDALFLCGGLLWACYTVAMRRARLDGMHAAAIAAVGTLLVYLPVYAVVAGTNIFLAPLTDIALQAFVQGVLTAIVSLVLYGRAVGSLGASGGAAFPALCPVMTALLGIPVLGEWPTLPVWFAIVLISTGAYALSGGPVPGRRAGKPDGGGTAPRAQDTDASGGAQSPLCTTDRNALVVPCVGSR
jgi:drug/metabolite transporter (DMT)-like permease